jgi:hypothetical protein
MVGGLVRHALIQRRCELRPGKPVVEGRTLRQKTSAKLNMTRRILWSLYAWPVTLMVLASECFLGVNYEGNAIIIFAFLDLCISFPSLYALQLHIWDKKLFSPLLWKIYAFIFYAWNLIYNVFIGPAVTGEALELDDIIGLTILLPLFFAVYRYAFRKWEAAAVEGKPELN